MKYDIAGIQQQVQSSIRDRHFIGNYEIKRKIGEGTFSSVFLAVHIMTRHEVVLKSAEKNQTNLASEIANMSLLYHPHIVRLYEYIVTEDKVWLVLEYCGGEELFSYLVRCRVIPPQQACQLFAQLAGAVAYAHQKNCAHRDIKLENVLLDENGTIKLGDFGFTRNYVPKTMLETVCGTESYMAPELLLRKKYYPEAADVWSLGVILYAMIYGKFPFDDDNVATTNRLVVEEDPPYPKVEGGEMLVDMTRKILNKDPRKRPSVAQILEQLGESGKQQQILLLKLEANPQLSHVFTSKEERAVLKGMKVLNIDLHALAFSVVNHKCDPLHGLWYTALDRQRVVKSQDGSASSEIALRRHKSRASVHSARSFVGQKIARTSHISLSRQGSISRSSARAVSLTSPSSTADLRRSMSPGAEGEGTEIVADNVPGHIRINGEVQAHNRNGSMRATNEVTQNGLQHDSKTVQTDDGQASSFATSRASSATVAGTARSSADGSASSLNPTVNSKSRRTIEKIWAALKLKRGGTKDTLIAYYRPYSERDTEPPQLDDRSPFVSGQDVPQYRTPSKVPARDSSSSLRDSPVLDLGSKSFSLASGRHSTLSSNSTSSLVPAETPVRRGGGGSSNSGGQQGHLSQQHSSTTSDTGQHPSQPSITSLVSQNSGPSSHNSIVSTNSNASQGSPHQPQSAFAAVSSPAGISRPMSTYSEMSTLSQISESSVDASQLLSDIQDSPQDSKPVNPTQRWRSFANAGLAKKNVRDTIATGALSTPPRPASMRQRVRMLSLKERIPQKIDESEGEGDE